jgi:hypothetical protein
MKQNQIYYDQKNNELYKVVMIADRYFLHGHEDSYWNNLEVKEEWLPEWMFVLLGEL